MITSIDPDAVDIAFIDEISSLGSATSGQTSMGLRGPQERLDTVGAASTPAGKEQDG